MGGLTVTNPVLGWGLVLGVVAIAGLPPLGIFMSEFLVVSSTFAREPWLVLILVFGILVALGGLFLRLNTIVFGEPRRTDRAGAGVLRADVRPSRHRVHGGHLHAAGAGHRLPERRQAVGIAPWPCSTPSRIAKRPSSTGRGRAPSSPTTAGGRRSISWRPGAARCSDCGATRRTCTWRCWARISTTSPCSATPARTANIRASPRATRRRSGWNAPSAIYSGWTRSVRPTRAPGSISGSGTCAIRSGKSNPRRSPRLTPFCRRRAKACIRFRSAPCMPASSSRAISASPPMASTWCAWSSGSAMCTRASSR